MLIHVHGTCVPAVGITAGGIVPDSARPGCKPDVEGADEDTVRVVRIHCDRLIVPILRVIASAILAVSKRAALRALHVAPGSPAVRGSPGADLAPGGIAATAVVVTDNGLHLGVDVVRVTRGDGNVHSTQLSAGRDVNKR